MVAHIRLPKLKFCGLTRADDVMAAVDCRADAIGLNFYPASPRYVHPTVARQWRSMVAQRAMMVGVFVNASPGEVAKIVAECPLDCVQLHGDENPGWMDEAASYPALQSISFIKAVAWRGLDEDQMNVERWTTARHPRLLGLLVDSYDPVQRGGTGRTARWDLLVPRPIAFRGVPLLLAGGLTTENISQAIQAAQPDGVDIASGIESAPGVKERSKMQAISAIALPLLG
jgi:phosphoribosylanthranilate isomerase